MLAKVPPKWWLFAALLLTALAEPAIALTTNWTKAIDFSGDSEYARQEDDGSDGALYQPRYWVNTIRMSRKPCWAHRRRTQLLLGPMALS